MATYEEVLDAAREDDAREDALQFVRSHGPWSDEEIANLLRYAATGSFY